jgi:hypothetical protein
VAHSAIRISKNSKNTSQRPWHGHAHNDGEEGEVKNEPQHGEDALRHHALIDVSAYGDDVEVPSFQRRVKCGKCGSKGRWIDVRPNWKEQPVRPTRLRYDFAGREGGLHRVLHYFSRTSIRSDWACPKHWPEINRCVRCTQGSHRTTKRA